MAEYAPANLKWLGSRVGPDLRGTLSGIIGDRFHTYGYHRGRNYVSSGDYSTQLAEDRRGDGEAAAGIDMSFSDSLMRLYTSRLKAAADRNDPRIKNMREFYGTLDSNTVYGRTHAGSGDSTWERSSADSSHLWHIHISILRQYSNDRATMQGILDVLLGKPLSSTPTPTPVKGKKMFFIKVKSDDATFISDGVHRRAVNSWQDMQTLAKATGASLTPVETDTWDHLNKLGGKLVIE